MTSRPGRQVGILTLPFNGNYGGMIQAVALYSFLRQQGMKPVLIRKTPWTPFWKRALVMVLRHLPGQNLRGIRRKHLLLAEHDRFLRRVMPQMTGHLHSQSALTRTASRLDAVVVGSDQVWRDFNRDAHFLNYFLDFVPDGVRRISYAPSFGVSSWTMPGLTGQVSALLQRFDMVSVREDSGVAICREIFGRRDARQALDPTLLLEAATYEQMIPASSAVPGRVVLRYVLDETDAMTRIEARLLEEDSGLTTGRIENGEFGKKRVISLPDWLRGFRDAEWVLTDSFHGMAFAIIFRKNFYAFGNRKRGLDRFTSLLTLLGLQDRLITDAQTPERLQPVDYGPVEAKLAALRQSSGDCLLQAIHGPRQRSG